MSVFDDRPLPSQDLQAAAVALLTAALHDDRESFDALARELAGHDEQAVVHLAEVVDVLLRAYARTSGVSADDVLAQLGLVAAGDRLPDDDDREDP